MREVAGVGSSDIVDRCIGSKEAVGEVVGKTAVELGCYRPDIVVLVVHVAGERLADLACTVELLVTIAVVARVAVRSIPLKVLGSIVTDAELVGLGNVPVDTGKKLGVVDTAGIVSIGTRIIVVLLDEFVLDLLEDGVHDYPNIHRYIYNALPEFF